MKKKLLALVLASAMALGLAACGSTNKGGSSASGSAKSTKAIQEISCSDDAYYHFYPLIGGDKEQKHFAAIYLNTKGRPIKKSIISIGTIDMSPVHPRDVFRDAVKVNAACIIIAHNHPSGVLSPSRDDIDLTRRMIECGELMGVKVLDHLIIGNSGFLSLKSEGLFD